MKTLRISYKIFLFLFLGGIIIITGLYTYAYFSNPVALNKSSGFYMYDSSDNLISQGSTHTKWISLDEVSPYLIDAVISVEDKNFYKHAGFDYLRIIKAMGKNIKRKNIVEGASTISQQYIKNAYLEFDKTWTRKIKEASLTINLESHYSKDEILEAYLNTINYGKGNYGIDSASKYYFNINAKDLSLEQAIMLAGIPKSPNNYNPVSSYENCVKRAKIVALTMLNNKKITKEEYDKLFKDNIPIYGKTSDDDLQMLMYYQNAVLNELKTLPNINEELISSGNLNVYTTLDYNVQKEMEKNILNNISEDMEVASVIVDPDNGNVLALSGGKDYSKSEFNRALKSKRQVGSSMKPFLYYAALENGMTSSSKFLSQYTTFTLDNGKTYSPKNYGEIYPNDEITMSAAVAYSDNIYAVKTNLFLGVDTLINTAHICGIKEELNPVASLALGTSELNILDFAAGYTTFASGGYKREIHFINKVTDNEGNILYEFKPVNNLVLNPNYVYILNEILTAPTSAQFIDYNTPTAIGIAPYLTQKYALKTGTTDTDYWAVGYNKDKLMLVWEGYDNNDNIRLGISKEIKNIWYQTMENIKSDGNNWYEMPKNVVGMPLNSITGNPTNDLSKTNVFYYLKGSEPQ